MNGAPTLNGESEKRAWSSPHSIDVFEDDAEVKALLEEEHLLACEEAIALVAEAYGRDWPERERRIKSEAWHLALAHLSAEQVKSVVLAELRARTNPYPPIPADIIARHSGEVWGEGEEGKGERVVVANAGAYQPLKPTRNELIARGLLDLDAPTPPGVAPSSPEGKLLVEEVKATLNPPRFSQRAAQSRNEEREREQLEFRINKALWEKCEMLTFQIKREVRLAFGNWLYERFPDMEAWTPELAREQWHVWQAEKE